MTSVVRLDRQMTVAGRPFTDPSHRWADLASLELMRNRLRQTIEALDMVGSITPDEPLIQYIHEDGQRLHRMVILDRAGLGQERDLLVVGFFGERRADASPALLQDIDTELIGEFLQHRYILSYSSLELADGNWGNLVILEHMDGIQHWRLSHRHAYAARELAPRYYLAIRLINASLPAGLASPGLALRSTKYYDFADGALWQAIREEGEQ